MRILLITDWMAEHGGAEWYVTAVRETLRAEGHDARLLTSNVSPEARSTADYLAHGSQRVASQVLLQVVNPLAVATVRRVLSSFRPDVVHLVMIEHHLSPAILAVLGGVPAVLSVQDYKPVCPTSWKLLPDGSICTDRAGAVCWRGGCISFPHWLRDIPRYRLLERGLGRVNRLLACSRTVQAELAAGGIPSDVLILPVRPPGRDFQRSPAPHPVFVYCGRLSREKGVALLLRSFAGLLRTAPTAHLRVVGRGAEGAALERLARELGIEERVTFTGWVPPEKVERELADAWVLVAPSLHAEPLGLVAVEAIVRGVPVIASARGGFAETIEEGASGLLFANGDEAGLSAVLEAVATRRAFPDQRIAPNVVRRTAEAHDLERHAESLVGIYRDLVHVSRPRSSADDQPSDETRDRRRPARGRRYALDSALHRVLNLCAVRTPSTLTRHLGRARGLRPEFPSGRLARLLDENPITELEPAAATDPAGGEWTISPAQAALLDHLVRRLQPRNVLEFGAGRSSLVLARALAKQGGGRLTAIEQSPEWCGETWAAVERVAGVDARLVPFSPRLSITRHGVYPGYDGAEPALAQRGPFDLVHVDAPQWFYGREGTLHAARPHLATGAVVVLDDARRSGERWILCRWLAMFPGLRLVAFEPDFGRRGVALLEYDGNMRTSFSPAPRLASAVHALILCGTRWCRPDLLVQLNSSPLSARR